LADHEAVTPVGKPMGVPIPVAPVVACVMVVIGLFTQTDGLIEPTPAVVFGLMFIVPDFEITLHTL